MGVPEPLSFGSFLPNGVEGKEKFRKCSQPGILSTQGEWRTCQRSALRGKPWITSHPIHCCFWLAISGSPDAETLLESNSSFLTPSYSPLPSLQKTIPCFCLPSPKSSPRSFPRGLRGRGQGQACFSSVQSLSRVRLFATPWITARQASLSITNSRSLLKLMPIDRGKIVLCIFLGRRSCWFPSSMPGSGVGWGARNAKELLKRLIGNRAQGAPDERRTKTGKPEVGKAGATWGRVQGQRRALLALPSSSLLPPIRVPSGSKPLHPPPHLIPLPHQVRRFLIAPFRSLVPSLCSQLTGHLSSQGGTGCQLVGSHRVLFLSRRYWSHERGRLSEMVRSKGQQI